MNLSAKTGRIAFWCLAALLMALTCILHFWKIGPLPSGMYGDECSIGYNAFCIEQTGADEYGTRYPIFFRGFDNYHDPVMVYCLVPLVRNFGLNASVARLPSAVFHILASVMFALLVQAYCRNRWLALVGGLVFSVIPWVFPVSRSISAGYTPMLLGMTAGWLWLMRAFGKKSHGYAIAAGAAWAFTMYSHNIGRPMTALLLLCFAIAYGRVLLFRWKVAATFAASFLAVLTPMLILVWRTPEALTARFQTLSIFRDQPTFLVLLLRFGSRFLEYFSPQYLWLRGDPNVRHNIGFGGELFWFLAPLIAFGLFAVFRHFRRQPHFRFLAAATLVYPTAACLTEDHMHSMRSIDGVIFWSLLAAVGARLLWQNKGIWRKLLFIILCAGFVESALYLQTYFGSKYQAHCRTYFQGELADALKYCFQHLGKDDVLYISNSTFCPHGPLVDSALKPFLYAYVLFYGKIDPQKYQQLGFPMDTVRLYENNAPKSGLLLRCNFRWLSPTEAQWVANDEPVPAGSTLVAHFPFLNSDLRFEVIRFP